MNVQALTELIGADNRADKEAVVNDWLHLLVSFCGWRVFSLLARYSLLIDLFWLRGDFSKILVGKESGFYDN